MNQRKMNKGTKREKEKFITITEDRKRVNSK